MRTKNRFTCQRVLRAYVLTYQLALFAHVPTCLPCSRAHMSMSLSCSRAQVTACLEGLRVSRVKISCVLPWLIKLYTLFRRFDNLMNVFLSNVNS